MMSDLDRNSTDAMHWAEQLVKTARENNFTPEQVLDEGWLVGWFANYWAAVRDPLQAKIEELERINYARETKIVEQARSMLSARAKQRKLDAIIRDLVGVNNDG
jgi:hypothetical protein